VTFTLTGKQRRFLRGLGHALKPVVQVGHAGLTEPVLKAIDRALETHELIKIKVASEAGDGADALVDPIERTARTAVAQVVGKTLLVYRGRKKQPAIVLPDEHQPGSVNAPAPAEKPARPGRHLAKKRPSKRGPNGKRSESTPRTDANRHAEGSRKEGKSRRAASLRRAEPAPRAESGARSPSFGRPQAGRRRKGAE
jgi:RNA-binding protein